MEVVRRAGLDDCLTMRARLAPSMEVGYWVFRLVDFDFDIAKGWGKRPKLTVQLRIEMVEGGTLLRWAL